MPDTSTATKTSTKTVVAVAAIAAAALALAAAFMFFSSLKKPAKVCVGGLIPGSACQTDRDCRGGGHCVQALTKPTVPTRPPQGKALKPQH